jgi:hypothetical protein
MIVYSKEYIADNKVMRRDVFKDGKVKVEYVRDIEFKDTKKYPNLRLNVDPVDLIHMPSIAKEVIETVVEIQLKDDINLFDKQIESIKPNTIDDIKKIVDTLGDIEKQEEKKKRRKKNEEIVLPKPEDLD